MFSKNSILISFLSRSLGVRKHWSQLLSCEKKVISPVGEIGEERRAEDTADGTERQVHVGVNLIVANEVELRAKVESETLTNNSIRLQISNRLFDRKVK